KKAAFLTHPAFLSNEREPPRDKPVASKKDSKLFYSSEREAPQGEPVAFKKGSLAAFLRSYAFQWLAVESLRARCQPQATTAKSQSTARFYRAGQTHFHSLARPLC
ncbi:MAG TPA: hypothetical protein VI750_13130, partial [Pyrinomonadaceae bacterium]|nr:hypothetical protein [Pyrinomonadaceae bacterium]